MSTNVGSITSHFPDAENGFVTTLASTISSGAGTVPLNSVAGYTNGQPAVFVIDPSDITKKQTFTGIIDTAGVQVTSVVWTAGTDQTHAGGATVVDYATATHIAMMSKGILVHADQDGTLKAGAVDNAAVLASNVVTTAKILDDNVTAPKIVGIDKSNLTTDSNPYKFHAEANSAQTVGSADTLMVYNTETFDTNNNFASSIYTAPVAGFYFFYSYCHTNPATNDTSTYLKIYKNGSAFKQIAYSANGQNVNRGLSGTIMMSLASNDTISIYGGSTGGAVSSIFSGVDIPYFGGYLMSRT